jgi:multiple sugar transport system substrate-binding protein
MKLLKRLTLTAAAALAVGWTAAASAETAAERAVNEAKQYSGTTITIVWEAGLQSLDPLNFSGPKWKELTGIDVKVVEVQTAEMFTKIMQEYRAGTGAYDALNVIPAWMADLANAGALEELDPYVDKYGFRDELQKIAPTYRDNQMKVNGKIYGFPDDGDVFVMYYRKDVFGDPDVQKAFKDKLGLTIEQLSDWEPKGETCRAFGVYHEGGFPARAIVIIDPDGLVKWSYRAANPGELPGANLIFDGLDA